MKSKLKRFSVSNYEQDLKFHLVNKRLDIINCSLKNPRLFFSLFHTKLTKLSSSIKFLV